MMDLRDVRRRSRTTTQEREVQVDRLLGERFVRTTIRRCAAPSLMTVLAVVVGVGLLGLAGWFIAASAVAGLAVASTFSFLFPSAGVQALAWARTLARYGERITTHRATLDLVAALRTALFATAVRLPRDRAADLRSSELIGRLTIDSDAVEQILLRSAFPIIAAAAAAFGAIAAFTSLSTWVGAVATAGLTITAATLVVSARRQVGAPAQTLVAARAGARRALIEAVDGLPELRSFGAERRRGEPRSHGTSRCTPALVAAYRKSRLGVTARERCSRTSHCSGSSWPRRACSVGHRSRRRGSSPCAWSQSRFLSRSTPSREPSLRSREVGRRRLGSVSFSRRDEPSKSRAHLPEGRGPLRRTRSTRTGPRGAAAARRRAASHRRVGSREVDRSASHHRIARVRSRDPARRHRSGDGSA